MAEIFGLDFGTTNSLAAFVARDEVAVLMDEDGRSHPSVVWYRGDEVIAGRIAKDQLADLASTVVADIVRSPKSFLGEGQPIHVAGLAREASDVVGDILRHVVGQARRERPELRFDRAVATIPVTMGGPGRRELRAAASRAGVTIEQFVHEPLAALYGWLRRHQDFEQRLARLQRKTIVVFDWGGGTLDLTLCEFTGPFLMQVRNYGDRHVGGDRFDEALDRLCRERHASTYSLDHIDEMPGAAAKLVQQCELAKIGLSSSDSWPVLVPEFMRSSGPERNLVMEVTRRDLESATRSLVDEGMTAIDQLLDDVKLDDSRIELLLPTGGMVQSPLIRNRLVERFGIERAPLVDRAANLIAEGAAWIGHQGLQLTLAKPFELLLADDAYASLIAEGTKLPRYGESHHASIGLYCVDPRDHVARFLFSRPDWPGRAQPGDRRAHYGVLLLAVDPTAKPLLERLELQLTVDQDLIAHVAAGSPVTGEHRTLDIHDLEFGLQVGG